MTSVSSATHFSPIKSGSQNSSENNWVDYYIERFQLKIDKESSFREKKLLILHKFYDGSIYDNLSPFYQEFSGFGSGQYIPLARRRPSVKYNICKIISDESIAMLFGEGHFPIVRCEDENTEKFLQYITRKINLPEYMINSARYGCVGSVCIAIKVLEKKIFLEIIQTKNSYPYFNIKNPDQLIKVEQKKAIDGNTLVSYGYNIKKEELNDFFYVKREWTETEEIFYMPYLCSSDKDQDFKPTKDIERSSVHNFGFVPIIWIKNITSCHIDGHSTFGDITDIQIEIDYQLSQNGRLLKYNSDPTLVVKNPTSLEGNQLMKGIGILSLDEKGDAYYAEMSGKSTQAVMDYVKQLREYAIEVCRGNRTSPDKIQNAQSGKALEMLNMPLIGLVGEMRLTYGGALLKIYEMILKIYMLGIYDMDIGPDEPTSADADLTLDWPDWYPQSSMEKLQEAQALTTYKAAGLLSIETAINNIADEYNILDTDQEINQIDEDTDKKIENDNKLVDNNTLNKAGRGAQAGK